MIAEGAILLYRPRTGLALVGIKQDYRDFDLDSELRQTNKGTANALRLLRMLAQHRSIDPGFTDAILTKRKNSSVAS